MAAGHPDARWYPIGRAFNEADLVLQREKELQAQQAVLLQLAVSSLIGGKEELKAFKDAVDDLTGN